MSMCCSWWITGLVLHRTNKNWLIPFLLYLAIILRLVTLYAPMRPLLTGLRYLWTRLLVQPTQRLLLARAQTPLGAVLVICVFIVGAMGSPEAANNTRSNRAVSLFGLAFMLFALWITSKHRSHIAWRAVIVGMLVQFVVALVVLRTKPGYDVFTFLSEVCRLFLGFADRGSAFITSDEFVESTPWQVYLEIRLVLGPS